jgi:aspartyl-tRNA synthetase
LEGSKEFWRTPGQYDIACDGYEIASGGIRNHRTEAMVKAFEIAGHDGGLRSGPPR